LRDSLVLMAGEWQSVIEVHSPIVSHGAIVVNTTTGARPPTAEPGEKAQAERATMSANIIISYDGTNNEDDAVALGRLLAGAGAEVSLAYVRHAPEPETSREILAQHEAETLLQRGAQLLGNPDAARHVITDRSTPEGLSTLAAEHGADVIVFCSDSHTAKGHLAVGNSAQRLLNGGATAVAIAPAGFAHSADQQVRRVGVAGDGSAQATAEALASTLGAELSASGEQSVELLVVGSRPEAEEGRVSLSAASENLIEIATCPVLVVPRGKAVAFDGAIAFTA
ncbi:MAG TPA: universal stress protein, partial [Solirubrobacteraceae bacterium]|nr:universal stress protein [Solirubrobacteraceae bacterium]